MKQMRNRGIALISVLLILSAMMVLTMGFATFTATDHIISKAYHRSAVTLYLAQAGLEYAMYLLKHNMLIFPGWPPQGDDEDGDGNLDPYDDQSADHQGYKRVGEAVNLFPKVNASSEMIGTLWDTEYDSTNGYYTHGEEHLVISQLSWGDEDDNYVYWILGDNNYCGTFLVQVYECADPVASDADSSRVLIIKSIGKVKKIPSGSDPTGDTNFKDDSVYEVQAKRTLIMRVPYKNDEVLKLYDNEENAYNGTETADPYYFKILNDGMFERYR